MTVPPAQQPDWPDHPELGPVTAALATALPLVLPAECDLLKRRIAEVAAGEAFLMQGGDCAESFDTTVPSLLGTVDTLRLMGSILGDALSLPTVLLGRIAGQYAKPRSAPTETRDDLTLPAYRGDAVNGAAFTARSRLPDPTRLLRAHQASAATLNLIRAVTAPGEFFTSHEGLLLDYERPLTRVDPRTGHRYAGSAHLLWIGERTRDLDGPHADFFATIHNPIAVKIGPTAKPETLLRLMDRLDPGREPGRLTFICRMGAARVRDVLPAMVDKVRAEAAPVAWVSDPVHGNTFTAPSGHKTRRLTDVLDELSAFFEIHRDLGTHPGGVHVEVTGDDVTECVGAGVDFADLPSRYRSLCDPRLNRTQALAVSHRLAEAVRCRPSGAYSTP